MKKINFVIAIVLLFSIFSCKNESREGITVVSIEEMQMLSALDNVQLVDVRTPKEYNAGHLPNAQNIDFNSPTFEQDIKQLDKNKPIILYCQKGGRSAKCADKMHEAGFKKIFDLKGGFSKWQFKTLDLKL